MHFVLTTRLWAMVAVLLALGLTTGAVFAHERRDVGRYQLVVGFSVEPAFEGQKNGVSLRVTNTESQEPVEGLQETLQVEITHVPSGTSKVFPLKTVWKDPGHYTADLLLTAPGYYRMRFFGSVAGLEIDETFESRSGGGGFNDVESSAEIQFPQRLPEVREIEAAVRGNQTTAQGAEEAALKAGDKASSAGTLAMVALVVGAVGAAGGASSLVLVLRRR